LAVVVLTLNEPQNIRFTFRKAEKLCSQKIISALFQPGFFISKPPFRINVLFTDLPVKAVPAQVVFVVGKKRFKRAVDRNRIKRLLREMYRKKKHEVYEALQAKHKTAALALFYTGTEMLTIGSEKEFNLLITKLIHEIRNK
jgi:ribonuclease P protein component